ncbi:radical SAM protein [Rubeoparvulum massiliense]|uniref:radical SAM protein n=1 Tax=Rubeoparvulum massiliense TaxID=1631346 RepID=UPI00065DE5BE|nr:radical SAM protein [Rubeoparvulum massiliense]
MGKAKQFVSQQLVKEGIRHLEKNPEANFGHLIDWAEHLVTKEDHERKVAWFRKTWSNPESNWNQYIHRFFNQLDPHVQEKFLINFMVNAGIVGIPLEERMREKYQCNIPWAILMDPTAACNLRCTGCWAAEYNKNASMDNQLLERIIEEGEELGIYMYIFSGGEPLVRKHDLLEIAKRHSDCMFLAFTNATLVDEAFAEEMVRAGNMMLAISVEGFEKETDMRRGVGTYQKVMRAMDILREHGAPFGFSTCYHRKNAETIASEEYIDFMLEKGCMFGWYFTYMPIGKDAVMDLVATPEQREYMYHRVRELRSTKPIFIIDFWNDGEYVDGCIAGGRRYLHINANGDVEPCAFIHYSNVNIRESSLLEALRSPLFMQYHVEQPFNHNHLQPCPLLDNPQALKRMVHRSEAISTQPLDEEDVDDLTGKCEPIAEHWAVTAERLWNQHHV